MEDKGFDPQYDDSKKLNEIIFGRVKSKPDGSTYRKVELLIEPESTYLSKKVAEVLDSPMTFKVKEDLVLYSTQGGQQKIHCWLVESSDGKQLNAINISRRTGKGVYGSQEITLLPEAILAFREFLNKLIITDTSNNPKFSIQLSTSSVAKDSPQIISPTDFVKLIKDNIKSTDDFYKLLSVQKMELAVQELGNIVNGEFKNEIEIQKFLKENLWMFGNYYAHIVEDEKINAQNILDIIPQNIESYVDIIEVKLPGEILFHFDESHRNYYCTSKLTKAIAQTQNYIYELDRKSADERYQQKNNCRIVRPRGMILYGSNENLDASQTQYLRILNASYHNLQIITYQQLLQKAQNTLAFSKCD